MTDNKSETKEWFEVLLRRQEDWVPHAVEAVVMDAYRTTDFFASSAEFDDDLFQLMRFVTDGTSALPRPMDMYDLLQVCVTRPSERGRALAVKTFIIVPSDRARLFKTNGRATHTTKIYPDIAIVQLPVPWAMSGRLPGFKHP